MTSAEDLVAVEVASETIRPGDVLVIDTVDHHVDAVRADPVLGDYVYAFVPEQLPIPRGRLVKVRRPRSQTTLADRVDPLTEQLAEVRDLALALAEQAGKDNATGTAASRARVADRAARVRARLEETTTDGTAGPDAPVLGQPQPVREPAQPAPAAPAAPVAGAVPVEPAVRPGAAKGKG